MINNFKIARIVIYMRNSSNNNNNNNSDSSGISKNINDVNISYINIIM
ncbi:MAG: hypothetical protein ACRC1M_01920 [Methanobacteriaceae archaeon]